MSRLSFLMRQALAAGGARLVEAGVFQAAAGLSAILVAGQLALILVRLPALEPVPILLLLASYALRSALGYAAEMRAAEAGARLKVDLRHKLYTHLLELGPLATARMESGALSVVLVERVEACEGYAARYLPSLFSAILIPLAVVAVMLPVHPRAAVALLLLGLTLPLLLAISGLLAKAASEKQFVALQRLGGLFHDRLQNLPLLKIFGAVERESVKLEQSADELRRRTMHVLRVAFLSSFAFDLLAVGGIIVAVMLTAAPSAAMLFTLLLVPEFFAPLRTLMATYHDRMNAVAASGEIERILTLPVHHRAGTVHRVEVTPKPTLEFRGVRFGYDIGLFENLNFKVGGGEFVALTGPSGAGKSTLVNLLLGFARPLSGEILVNSTDLERMDADSRAGLFGWVGQRSFIFHGTLADNIRLARPEASDDEVMAAVRAAQLEKLIARLPEGLDAPVGERGYGLSGGEAQRLALARAFLQQGKILLLDEPTAGLDSETAAQLLSVIRLLASERTVLMVSHDPVALAAAGRVLRLESGTVREAA